MTYGETIHQDSDLSENSFGEYLSDGKISPEEIAELKEIYTLEGASITDEVRNDWGAFSYDLRKEFQAAISVIADETINPETISRISEFADIYELRERENYNEEVLGMTIDASSQISGVIYETRELFPSFISQKEIGDINIIPSRGEGDWKFTGLEIRTSNDNLVPRGKDDGLTFGIHADIEYTGANQESLIFSGGVDSYTDNPLFIQQDDGNVQIYNRWDISRRVDRGYIQGVYSNDYQVGENTKLTFRRGLGVGFTGDLGGEKIQNNWHESNLGRRTMSAGNEYTVHAPYEKGDSAYVYGVLGVEGRYNLTNSIYVNGGIGGKFPIYGEGPTILEGNIGIGFDTKYIDTEVGLEYYSHTGDPSSLINDFYSGEGTVNPYLEVSVGNNNIGPEIFGRFSGKQRGQGSVGVRWNF